MSRGALPDLLREWRLEEGLEAAGRPDRLALLQRGGWIGVGLIGLGMLLGGAILWRQSLVDQEIESLAAVAALSGQLEQRLQRERGQRLGLEQGNRRLAEGLVAVRSGSALLSDLQRRTPEGVQLQELKVLADSLSLQGQARDPGALQRINALLLTLQASPFLQGQEVLLRRASRGTAEQAPLLAFEISGPFRERDSRREASLLRQLGADGMASRLEALLREGLLP
ncbi:MAG: PilN domain-containing protein [Cyanobacteriota bacterium]|jgi:type IV pilus assembly protein PilN|nr:PilN domain-containing protein [Cyanobacteriota bacterium]